MGGHIVARPFFSECCTAAHDRHSQSAWLGRLFSIFLFYYQCFMAFTHQDVVGSAPFCVLYPTVKSLSTGHVAAQDNGTQS
jgi:hypothetical protein